MADFCWDCVQKLDVPPEKNDIADMAAPGFVAGALCEGCGFGYFDSLGKRIDEDLAATMFFGYQ